MAFDQVNIGAAPNDGTGDPIRNAFSKINDNYSETVATDTSAEPAGSDQVLNMVSLTQAEYDAGTPVATTLYLITDA